MGLTALAQRALARDARDPDRNAVLVYEDGTEAAVFVFPWVGMDPVDP